MLVVLANGNDEVARSLVARWEAQGACLLSPAGLSISGWRHYSPASLCSAAVLGGRVIDLQRISGVLTRLPCVTEGDLPHIVPSDRGYVAAEMTAFLLAWLSSLECRVVNRPTPMGLWGPNWRREQWAHCAARIGIPVATVRRVVTTSSDYVVGDESRMSVTLTVVGDRCLGGASETLASRALDLARAAGVDLLEVDFSGAQPDSVFLGARVRPANVSDEVADAILEVFQFRLAASSGAA